MNEFYSAEETETKSNTWKLFAIILLLIALVLLFFYFYGYPVSLSSLGNHIKVVTQTPSATYSIQ
jgi:Na+/H+ antiporter NhaC